MLHHISPVGNISVKTGSAVLTLWERIKEQNLIEFGAHCLLSGHLDQVGCIKGGVFRMSRPTAAIAHFDWAF
ncbi:hypothetical protein xavtCFBP7764_00340 [Xanthomonas citri]|nr:hypothetical protein xavtCFBP7764_00340 [Xanthomonas citri]